MLADDETVANTDAIPEYDIDFSCGNAVMYADGSAPIVGSVRMPEYAGASAIVRAQHCDHNRHIHQVQQAEDR